MYLTLLYARDAIFKLIGQFVRANKFDDGELYIHNYCESALESAFDVLGIEENYIKLKDFCKMWEENSRAIWFIKHPGLPFVGITADVHYDVFKADYESWHEELDVVFEDD